MTEKDGCADTIADIEAHTIAPELAASSAAILKAVADPLRLRMLAVIASSPSGEACVCDLNQLADVSGPTVSHHLKTLREAGVVESERRGTWVYYRVAAPLVPAVRALLESLVPASRPRVQAPMSGLEDADAALDRAAHHLAGVFPELEPGVVARVVRESYTALARRAAMRQYLVPLAEHFATQRLQDLRKIDSGDAAHPPQVLFVCVQNAGRSQLAAALVQHYAGDRVVVRSAGSMPAADIHEGIKPHLDELAATGGAFPKPLTDDAVRASDVVITMGCGDVCPYYPGIRYEDWQVGDPALASEAGIAAIRADIDGRVRTLLADLIPDLDLPHDRKAHA